MCIFCSTLIFVFIYLSFPWHSISITFQKCSKSMLTLWHNFFVLNLIRTLLIQRIQVTISVVLFVVRPFSREVNTCSKHWQETDVTLWWNKFYFTNEISNLSGFSYIVPVCSLVVTPKQLLLLLLKTHCSN